MKRSLIASSFALLLLALLPACAPAAEPAPDPESDGAEAASQAVTAGPVESYYVVLEGPAAVKRIPPGVDPRSPEAAAAARARLVEIEAEHDALEPALIERGAVPVIRLSRLANAIQVLADEPTARALTALPGVKRVERVPLLSRSLTSAVRFVKAPAVWGGVPGLQGDGVTIGVIDSGIDYTHADFGGPGTPEAFASNDSAVIEPGSFPTAKVIGGHDFVGDAYNPGGGSPNPKPDPDPLDCVNVLGEDVSGGHGTHVSGIAAGQGVLADGTPFEGPYEASFNPNIFRVGPGVAPRASLYALRVFGCEGSTTMLGAALDRAADPNKDGSFDDRLDVVNGSLGSGYGLGSQMQGEMVKALTDLGTLIVAAAGNEGGNFFVTSSPATYPEVLSVAASSDNALIHVAVTAPAPADYPAAEGSFTQFLAAPLSAELVLASPALGCVALDNAAQAAGKVVLIRRGTCPFLTKLTNAQAAGAVGVIVSNNENAPFPFSMGGADPGSVGIPGVMVTMAHGAALESALSQGPVTITLDPELYTGPGVETLAGFTARGPSPIDGRLKPEITAPGLVDSAAVGTGVDAAFNGGTSMASPMIAGAAALVRQAQPELSSYSVKAALVNATVPLADGSSVPYSTSRMGAGRVDVTRAAAARLTAAADLEGGEVGVSFGAVTAHEPVTVKRTFTVTNHGQTGASVDASIAPTFTPPGVKVEVAPASADVAAGESFTFELTLSLDPAALGDPPPDPGTPAAQGMQMPTPRHYLNEASGVVHLVRTDGGGEDVALPYHGSVRAASLRKGSGVTICAPPSAEPEGPLSIDLTGPSGNPVPVVSAFQLGALDEAHSKSATDPVTAQTDLRAVGVATDLGAVPFDEARVFFGVAVTGDWTTPARGPISVVRVEINSNQAGGPEYELRVEARSPQRPYRDSLVTRVYNLATGAALSRHPINVVTPDLVRTHPFNSSVLVLSARLAEIGVDPEDPVFDWAAATERPDLTLQNEKVKGTFDAANLLVNTTAHGLEGTPLYTGETPLLVDVSPAALAAGTPVDVLLLHHTNTSAKDRWEVVSLVKKAPGNLAVTAEGPAEAKAGDSAAITVVVKNDGALAAPNVALGGELSGGLIEAIAPGQGTCAAGSKVDCALGEIGPGASVTVTVTVRRDAPDGTIVLSASAASDLECEPLKGDNSASHSIVVPAEIGKEKPDDVTPDKVVAAGGCACTAGAGVTGRDAGAAGALLCAVGLAMARRSRRRAIAVRRARS